MTADDPHHDPHHDPLERLEHVAERMADRSTYEQGNRLGLLWIHAVMGMLAGAQMALWGSATTIETALGIWSRVLMAALGVTGGVCLAIGLTRKPRSIPFEIVGLGLIASWDLLMASGLLYARMRQADFHLIPLDQGLAPGYVVAYPSTIYVGLFALVCVHLYTLRRIKRRRHKR